MLFSNNVQLKNRKNQVCDLILQCRESCLICYKYVFLQTLQNAASSLKQTKGKGSCQIGKKYNCE